VLVFDALGDEPVDAGPRLLPVEPPRLGSRSAGATAAPAPGRHRHAAQLAPDTERALRRAVVGVSAALVMVLAALVGSELAGGGPPPAAPLAHRSSVRALQPSSTAPVASPTTATTAVPASVPAPPPTSGTATTVPAPPPTPGGPPVLASLQPSSGTAGQSVVVSGSGFLSASGHIGATVGGQTASVSCPDQTTCTVTIPPQVATAATAPVVIVTDGGSSNPLTFTLG
jgi:IPT/TIG domain